MGLGDGFEAHEGAVAVVDQFFALLLQGVELLLVVVLGFGVQREGLVALAVRGVAGGVGGGDFLRDLFALAVEVFERSAMLLLHLREPGVVVLLLPGEGVALGGEVGDAFELGLVDLLELGLGRRRAAGGHPSAGGRARRFA